MLRADYNGVMGNFGVALGDVLRSENPRLRETNLGERIYKLPMKLPFMGLNECHVYTTPVSCRVSEIVVYRDLAERAVRSTIFGAMVKYMSTYGHVDVEMKSRTLGRLYCYNGEREVLFESTKILGRSVRFLLCYIDKDMKKLAEEEKEALFTVV